MHKLDRSAVAAPTCLASYNYPQNTWEDVSSSDKRQIRNSLKEMQDYRCAYCEGPIYSNNRHIEHFRRKDPAHFPSLTFAWSNLFLSCNTREHEHCGRYKDGPNASCYNPNDLVKPDEDDPDQFFYFHSSGEIRPRSGIDAGQSTRATETIWVFNLNCGKLKAERRRALRIYQGRALGFIEELMGLKQADRQLFISQEIAATRADPYWTVIRHFFERV